MKLQRIILIAVVFSLVFIPIFESTVLQAEEKAEYLYANDPWPPRITYDETTQELGGIDVKIIKEIAKRLDIKVKYAAFPWKRSLVMMKSGDSDILSSCQKRPEREEYMHFLEPAYVTSKKIFYVKVGSNVKVEKYEDLKSLKIGVNNGYKYETQFDEDETLEKVSVREELQLIEMLALDRIDTFVGTEMTADYLIIKHGYKGQFKKEPFYYKADTGAYITISKMSPLAERLSELNSILEELVNERIIEKLINEYFDELE